MDPSATTPDPPPTPALPAAARIRLPDIRRPRPRWVRWLRRLGWVVLALAVGEAIRYGYNHHRVTTRLREAVEELDRTDPGWRLADIEAAREEVPDEQNGARVVVEVEKLLPPRWPPQDFADAFQPPEPEAQLTPEQLALLTKELDAVRPAVEKARTLANFPKGRHRIHYQRNPLNTLLEDQQQVRRVTILLYYDVFRLAQGGDMKRAALSCRAALNAGRSIGDEPFFVSQLIRIACVAIACDAVERVLAQGEVPADELERLQRLLEDEDAHPGLLIATRGERAAMHELFDALESGDVALDQLEGSGRTSRSWQDILLGHVIRDNFRDEHPLMLSLMTRRVEETRLPLHEQAAAERAFHAEFRRLTEKAILTRLLFPAFNKVSEASRRKHACVRCLAALLAAERFRLKHARWPDSLAELVPDYLPAVPLDPYDGKRLRYKRRAEGVIVYSVGPDETDDGGTLDRRDRVRPGTDTGFRLWDVEHRRRPPRPREDRHAP
jgi:hypothetical protein